MLSVLKDYFKYYHEVRNHPGLHKDAPTAIEPLVAALSDQSLMGRGGHYRYYRQRPQKSEKHELPRGIGLPGRDEDGRPSREPPYGSADPGPRPACASPTARTPTARQPADRGGWGFLVGQGTTNLTLLEHSP